MAKDIHLNLKFKENENPKKRILAFTRTDGGACAHYRILSPAKHLTQDHNINYHMTNQFKLGYPDDKMPLYQNALLPDYHQYDTFIFQREYKIPIFEFMKIAQGVKNIKCVYEIDDDFENMPESSPSYKTTMSVLPQIKYFWAHANMITCTTEPLKELLSKYNKNVQVVPNAIDFDYWDQFKKTNYDPETVVIGWTGSAFHYDDIAFIEDIITDIVNKYDYVKFLYAGDAQINVSKPVDFFKGIPMSKRIILPKVTINKYPELISKIDIGIAPLIDNKFNESKSNLKYLEYSALGIPSVCSKVYPYAKTIKNGETGFLAKDKSHWKDHLENLITCHSMRRDMGQSAREFVFNKYNQKTISAIWAGILGGN